MGLATPAGGPTALTGSGSSTSGIDRTFCKINLLAAFSADMLLVEFIREYFFLFPALRTST
jgi:hypothetical protein